MPTAPLVLPLDGSDLAAEAKWASLLAALQSGQSVYLVYEKAAVAGLGHHVVRVNVPASTVCGPSAP